MNEAKKLYRSTSDRILFGVCGGLAEYFDLDPVIVRVVFIFLGLVKGIGIIIYLILAIAVPRKPGDAENDRGEKLNEFAETVGNKAREMAAEFKPKDEIRSDRIFKRRSFFGIALIIVGALLLVDKFFPLGWLDGQFIFSALIILLGIFIIFRK